MKFVFVSIDGMTDQLGQSQVLPYLIGLSKQGFSIEICSIEKPTNYNKNKDRIYHLTSSNNIKWFYKFYNSSVPLLSQRSNYNNLKKLVLYRINENNTDVVLHCRSYLPGLIGAWAKKKWDVPYIFDMRGFWADERIDGNIWKKGNLIHKKLYEFFKRKEKLMLKEAAKIVSLTNAAKTEIISWNLHLQAEITVIPCCADLTHFSYKRTDLNSNIVVAKKEGDFFVGYLGALGTWYMLDEMLDFFVCLLEKKPTAKFLFVTQDDKKKVLESAKEKKINPDQLIVIPASREEVPKLISLMDIGLFFIRPTYSKKASSPTKMAEILGCGVPVISNTGIGDVEEIINRTKVGICLDSFNKEQYKMAIEKINDLNQIEKEYLYTCALTEFSLTEGINRYKNIYLSIHNSITK